MDKLILWAIGRYWQEHGYAPAVRDVCALVDMSTATVHYYMVKLRKQGRVAYEDGKPRTLRLVG
jgi:repressor LexA